MSRYVDIDKPVIANVHNDATGKLAKMTVTIAELLAGTIEVLEEDIVRCKECVFFENENPCGIVDWWNGPDDFCSKGRRRIEG